MSVKYLVQKNLPILITIVALSLATSVFVWGIAQKQELRKQAASSEDFPNVDLNGDGVVNNIDLKIYLEKFSTPKP